MRAFVAGKSAVIVNLRLFFVRAAAYDLHQRTDTGKNPRDFDRTI